MYDFIDVNEVSENSVLPSEALMINGEFIENLIPGYRTLQTTGREILSAELSTFEVGNRDGSVLASKRYPARYITVKYQLIADTPEEFREAFNQLAAVLNVQEAELIFNDEPDKFFTGTPEEVGEVPGGTNAVIGEFVLFCADPFKYSVTEYEAEPQLDEGSFLINYNGTYKSFPKLIAEFKNEDESEAALTGDGDCGFVAFFNENEKIIQLGDPEEEDTEKYPKSQTLVSQKFNKETSWGTVAETNWATNSGKVSSSSYEQKGSVAMKVASYLTTVAPSTSGQLLSKTTTAAKPYINYTITAKTSSRTANSVKAEITIKSTANTTASKAVSITAGAAVKLSNTKLYVNATTSSNSGTKTGTYYIWDSSVKSGRVRITNAAKNAGKSGQVTGWVNVADIGATSTSGTVLGKEYGLQGSIQLNNGDWHNVTLKSESSTWSGNKSYIAKITVVVNDISADTTLLENIRFKVTRTDSEGGSVGELSETSCNNLEISTYTAPVPDTWYLMSDTYGTGSEYHGASITRTIPADAAGETGAENFTLTYKQKMAIGKGSTATQELGAFQAQIVSGSGSNRKILAGVNVYKNKTGKTARMRFYVNGKTMQTIDIDLSYNNKYFGNNSSKITTVKTSTITKVGNTVTFNIGGVKRTFKDNAITNVKATQITFLMAKFGTKPELSFNGLYSAKFVKNNCDTFEDIPNKFSTNDVVTADCQNGEIYLNDTLTPSLGALGNDWEDFYLTPGLNQIGFTYSDWVEEENAPQFKITYREVFI